MGTESESIRDVQVHVFYGGLLVIMDKLRSFYFIFLSFYFSIYLIFGFFLSFAY